MSWNGNNVSFEYIFMVEICLEELETEGHELPSLQVR